MIHNVLSSNEIADILNNPIVKTNKDKLSTQTKADFSIELPDAIKTKLETGFGINLAQIASIPMRWIKGDTAPHIDRGENNFNNTYLLYLTDSIGNLIIDGQSYPIAAGNAHIFSECLAHSTINTGDSERLMIGPMSETGFRVGIAYSIIYFNNETDANESAASIDIYGFPQNTTNKIGNNGYDQVYPSIYYKIRTVAGISSWLIAANTNTNGGEPTQNGGPYTTGTALEPTGIYYLYPSTPTVQRPCIIYFNNETDAIQTSTSLDESGIPTPRLDEFGNPIQLDIFGFNLYDELDLVNSYTIITGNDISSWYIAASTGVSSPPSPNGGPYSVGTLLNSGTVVNEDTGLIDTPGIIYYLYPYTPPPPPPPPLFSMRSLFTDNAKVYYKPGSLSTGGGGSGVTNSRIKQRRT